MPIEHAEIDLKPPNSPEKISDFKFNLFKIVEFTPPTKTKSTHTSTHTSTVRSGGAYKSTRTATRSQKKGKRHLKNMRGKKRSAFRKFKKGGKRMSGGVYPDELTPAEIESIKEGILQNFKYVQSNQKYATAAIAPFYSQIRPIYEVNTDISDELLLLYSNIDSYTNLTTPSREDQAMVDFANRNNIDSNLQYTTAIQPNRIVFNQTLYGAALPVPMNTITEEQAIANAEFISNAPLVMIITAKSMEHAIIFIIHGNTLYTAGFGYFGKDPNTQQKIDISQSTSARIFNRMAQNFTHKFEKLTGAIYTSDYLQPTEKHKCQIVWIGLLDKEMCVNINEYIQQTTQITFRFAIKHEIKENPANDPPTEEEDVDDILYVKSQGILTLADAPYCELANLSRGEDNYNMNCLKWAATMLNAQIYCGSSPAMYGVISKPSTCRQVSEEEVDLIFDLWKNVADPIVLIKNILAVQERLGAEMGYINQAVAAIGCMRGRPVQGGRQVQGGRHRRKTKKNKNKK
jgi:hypothetical protein